MSDLAATWSKAKKSWSKAAAKAVPGPIVKEMTKAGWDKGGLGKKLAAVDKAKDGATRTKAWAKAEPVVAKYQGAVAAAQKWKGLDKKAQAALAALATALTQVAEDGAAAQIDAPVEPSGRSEKVRLISSRNAAGGLRPKWLDVGAIDINAYLVVDAEVDRLEKDDLLGFHWTNLQQDCNKVVEKSVDAFAGTIQDLDTKMAALPPSERVALAKEANEVLKHYTKLVERQVNEVVDGYWARALKRQKYLKDFKKEVAVDIAMSSAAIVVSSASLVFSLGLAAPAYLAIAKSTYEIALSLEKLSRDAASMHKPLSKKMTDIEKLWAQRQKAIKNGTGQKASKAGQVAREALASAIGQASSKIMTTTSRTLKEAMEYTGKLSLLEQKAAELTKELAEFTKNFPSAPEAPDARTNAQMNKAHNNFKAMAENARTFSRELRSDIAFGENAVEVCENLKDEDYVPAWTKTAGTSTKAAIALASTAKVAFGIVTKFA